MLIKNKYMQILVKDEILFYLYHLDSGIKNLTVLL